jgi:hypothetical protein
MGQTAFDAFARSRKRPVFLRMGCAKGRDLYRRQYAAMERERQIMKDIPGWRAGDNVYHGQRLHCVDGFTDPRFVQAEYLVAPPDAGERKVEIREPRNWFWQRNKKDNKEQ